MTQRQLFINDWLSRVFSMRHLCGRYDISPKTGYKWVSRFRARGAGLVDHSRARHTQAHRVSPEMSGIILQCKYSYPRWRPKTIHSWLYRTHPDLEAPAVSTIGEILNQHGLVKPRRKRPKTPPHSQPLLHATGANVLWCGFQGSIQDW